MASNTLSSMTGFGTAQGVIVAPDEAYPAERWRWELRSVNGKGLDIRSRLPPGLEVIEPRVRELIGKTFGRGNITANLTLERDKTAPSVQINQPLLEDLLAVARGLELSHTLAPMSADRLLGLRGVLETTDTVQLDEAAEAARHASILAGLAGAIDTLQAARGAEGAALHSVLTDQLATIGGLVDDAAGAAEAQTAAIRARLADQVGALVQDVTNLGEDRLYQEAALIMTKADVREELDRLRAHVAAAHTLIAESGPVGRKLEFLIQEFNREANTLCSKSASTELTRIGLELKALIDQMREQVQNVE